jgi:predicted dehydrogenase
MSTHVSRRDFLKVGAYSGVTILVGAGLAKTYAANNRVQSAHIAVGGRGGAHVGVLGKENVVALCDVDRDRLAKSANAYPKAKTFEDYRKLFDEMEKDIDAVTIGTPDHHHATAAARAIVRGKHVYCEKPLTWSVHEARVLADLTRKHKVATQMGNQGHANQANRLIVEFIQSGAIGTVQETHTWTNRPIWPQGMAQRPASKPVPANLNWECWLGPAPYRDYHDGLHAFAWRGYVDFGCGAVGDMGCHTWDCVWWSMDPDAPSSAECIKALGRNAETFPKQAIYRWEFPAKGSRPGFLAYWYEGGLRPEVPEELAGDPRLAGKQRDLGGSGSLFIGTKGKLLAKGDYGGAPMLLGQARDWQRIPGKALEGSPGHHAEWVMACKGEKPWDYPKSNFLYAGPLVEAMNLGNAALLAGEKLVWDYKALKVTNSAAANKFIQREVYRKGWELIG